MSIQLDHKQLQLVREILKKNIPDRQVLIFGSRVTANYKPYSDLDLCILGKEPLSMTQLAELRERFSESDLSIRVDFVDWSTLSPQFQNTIKKKSLRIY